VIRNSQKIPDISVTYAVTVISSKTLMTVTAYVTEISGIFCEFLLLFVKHCLLKGFYPYFNFYLSSWKGSVVSKIIYDPSFIHLTQLLSKKERRSPVWNSIFNYFAFLLFLSLITSWFKLPNRANLKNCLIYKLLCIA
jgi:hypothetical protein